MRAIPRRLTRTGSVLLAALVPCLLAWSARGGTLADGVELYLAECSRCHGLVAGQGGTAAAPAAMPVAARRAPLVAFALPYGPGLAGVIGRPAGSVAGYAYSQAFLRAMGAVVWDAATLDEYLTDSQRRAPGARMYYAQPDPGIRRRIIDYLAATGAPARTP